MNDFSEEEYQQFIKTNYQKGRKIALEMGENFIPYLRILEKHCVKNPEEGILLFGIYLDTLKNLDNGYKNISSSAFNNFLVEFSSLEEQQL